MKAKKVIIKAYYNLGEEYIIFDSNPLHNTSYENVNVTIKEVTKTVCGMNFVMDVVYIDGQDPIECELVSKRQNTDGTLIIGICQDWG